MKEEQRNYYYMSKFYDRDIEQLKEWKRDGVTREEAKQRIDRRVLNDADIDRIYDKEDEQSKTTNIEESTQTKKKQLTRVAYGIDAAKDLERRLEFQIKTEHEMPVKKVTLLTSTKNQTNGLI